MRTLSCALLVISLVAGPVLAAGAKPNLVVIHTDEHSFRTLGCYRALLPADQGFVWGENIKVETPHIDSLAKNGAVCTRYYTASPVCTPSRASFVSGRYPQNTGAISNDKPMRDDVVTFAEVLRRNGYATGYAGKWHLDGGDKPGWGPKRKFGFEDNRYMFNRGHWKKLEDTPDGPRVKGGNNYNVAGADEKSFTTDFLADKTVEFIKTHKGKPFCYMVSIPDPHGPNTVRPPYDTMFEDLKFRQPPSAREKGDGLTSHTSVQPDSFSAKGMADYFGMVKCIDDNVGKILAALREACVLERTIVVFTSDHGDMCGEHGRHNKGIPLEASARIPFVIRAPGIVKPGTVVQPALTTVDFKPTILTLMGVKSDGGDEGRDASALFTGAGAAGWNDVAFSRIGSSDAGWMGAFTSRYKFVIAPQDEPCLFDLEKDPHEVKNVFRAAEYRETVRALARELAGYGQKYKEPIAENAAVRVDLAWAADGTGEYKTPAREENATGRKAAKKKRSAEADEN